MSVSVETEESSYGEVVVGDEDEDLEKDLHNYTNTTDGVGITGDSHIPQLCIALCSGHTASIFIPKAESVNSSDHHKILIFNFFVSRTMAFVHRRQWFFQSH